MRGPRVEHVPDGLNRIVLGLAAPVCGLSVAEPGNIGRNEIPLHGFSGARRTTMHRRIILGPTALAGIMLLAACNQETANNNLPAPNNLPQAPQNEPAPGSKNEAVSAAKDAVAGAVGTVAAELTTSAEGFVDDAAVNDMYEVQAGQLAEM